MDKGVWWVYRVHRVTKSQTQLNDSLKHTPYKYKLDGQNQALHQVRVDPRVAGRQSQLLWAGQWWRCRAWGNSWELHSMLGQTGPQDLSAVPASGSAPAGPTRTPGSAIPALQAMKVWCTHWQLPAALPTPAFSLCFSVIAKSTITQNHKTMQTSTALRNHGEVVFLQCGA